MSVCFTYKCFFQFFLLLTLLFLPECYFENTNPFDPNGKNYIPPSFTIKSEGDNVGDGDTIHRTSAKLFFEGNKKECRFQVKLNDGDTSEWQSSGEFFFKPLQDGLQNVVINCKYTGGSEIVSKMVSFTVITEGYIPKFSGRDSLVRADSLQLVTLSVQVSGSTPISFQWYKDDEIVNGQTQNILIIEHFSDEYAGVYYCVAANEYDTVKSPLLAVVFGSAFTITYDGNGNTSGDVPFDANSYVSGATITVKGNVGNLDKTGYNFAGWNTEVDGNGITYPPGEEITNVSSNVILYAMWSKTKVYNVVYKENGATSGYAPVDENCYDSGTIIIVIGNTGNLQKEDYTFVGWNTASNGNGNHYNPDEELIIPDATVILYAKWTQRNVYKISYDGNGNTGGTVPVDLNNYEDGSRIIVKENSGNLVKTGFSFAGWNTQADGNGDQYAVDKVIQVLSSDIILYAVWTEKTTYAVTYDGNGNTSGNPPVDNNKYEKDAEAVLKSNEFGLVKTGYHFKGWCTDKDGNGKVYAPSDTIPILGNTVLFAVWNKIVTCNVVYNGNGNTSGTVPVDTVQHETGSCVLILPNSGGMKKDDFIFAGWNTDSNGNGLQLYPGTYLTINSSVVLYANWTQNTTFTVTYNANGSTSGTSPVDSNRYVNGSSVTVLVNSGNLVKRGYSFAGWNTEPDGTGILYATGVTFAITSNVTLYAKWSLKKTYSVTYNGNSNSSGSVPVDANAYEAGNVVIIRGNTGNLVRDGYNFTGWNENADGSGTAHAPNSEMKIDTNSVILYAVWTKTTTETFKITYNGNGNTSGSVPVDNSLYIKGANAFVLSNSGVLVKSGYSFAGWCTDESGVIDSLYMPGDQITVTGNVSLWAYWTHDNTYKVIYHSNGSTSGAVPYDGNAYLPGVTVTVKGNSGNLEKTGSTFAGWTMKNDGSGVTYTENATFSKNAGNDTLYAKWSKNPTYTITYNSNNATSGSVPLDANLYEAGVSVNVKNNAGNLFLSGYDFNGWNTSSDGNGVVYAGGDTLVMPSKNVTLYADWKIIPTYSVIYDGNGNTGGTVPVDNVNYWTAQDVTVKDNLGLLVNGNLNFSGWNTQADGNGDSYTAGSTFKIDNSDVTLFAVWTDKPTFMVTYYANEATNGNIPTDNNKYVQGDNVKVMENAGDLARTGYTFEGWNTSSSGFGSTYKPGEYFTMGSTDVSLWAVWRPYYKVKYTGNGNTFGSSPTDTAKYRLWDVITIMGENTLQKNGFTFSGWNTTYDAKGKFYAQNDTMIVGSYWSMGEYSVTLHAAWKATITFDGQGADGNWPVLSSIYHPDTLLSSMPTPSKTGYTFAGWYTAVTGGTLFTASTKVTGNAIVYARWNPNEYVLTYNGNNSTGGTAPAGGTYNYNTTVTAASNTFIRDGYSFTGWNTAAGGNGKSYSEGADITISDNLTLYAQWSEHAEYTVTYDGSGNTGGSVPVNTNTYLTGDTIRVSGNTGLLTKDDSTFAGWSRVAGSGTIYNSPDTLLVGTADIVLYARWSTISHYSIVYNGNGNTGGSVPVNINTYLPGDTIRVSGNTGSLTKPDSTFDGWSREAGSGKVYMKDDTLLVGTENVSLYARWKDDQQYTITYYGNGNSSGTVPTDNSIYQSGETIIVLDNTGSLIKPDSTFDGWSMEAGSGKVYRSDDTLLVGTENVSLYARWKDVQQYTITYYGNGSSSGTVPADNNTYHSGETIIVLDNTGSLSKPDSMFDGWSRVAGSGKIYRKDDTLLVGTEDVTLYVRWQVIPRYLIMYDGNGNDGGDVPVDPNTYLTGDSVTVAANSGSLTKTDSTFAGWTRIAGAGKVYNPGDTLIMENDNITLYVKWDVEP